jgi:hypothetical protein
MGHDPTTLTASTIMGNTLKPHKICFGSRQQAAIGSVEIPFKLLKQLKAIN